MSTETSYTLTQLARIVSALENERRNPSSKAAALRAIERSAVRIGLSKKDVLAAADGLLGGRLGEAEWRAQLSDASGDCHTEQAVPEADASSGDSPAVGETVPEDDDAPGLAMVRVPTVRQQLLAACQAAERWLQEQDDPSEGADEILGVLRAAIARTELGPRQRRGPATPRQPRENTKEAQVIALLRQPQGVTLAQIGALTGWQAHSIRGFFAGALKKRRGMQVTSVKRENGERLYRITDGCC